VGQSYFNFCPIFGDSRGISQTEFLQKIRRRAFRIFGARGDRYFLFHPSMEGPRIRLKIPFNKPYMTGREIEYIRRAHANGQLAGDGPFTQKCHKWLEKNTGARRALLTHSCTAALEMAALLLDIRPGDEVIMPSYTFVSTANAFVLRGAVPVFVDIRPDTLNIDETKIGEAITKKTKAIITVHYGGIGCEMDAIQGIARRRGLAVIEDAAQAIVSSYKGKPLGGIGQLGALSFHETKTLISGEGGALLVNDPRLVERAEIIREKGTDRSRFFRGQVDKYTWQDVGSSYLPGDLIAAFLLAQLEHARQIVERRMRIWREYHEQFDSLESEGKIRRPVVPSYCAHNAHLYYLLFKKPVHRTRFIEALRRKGIMTVFHYTTLHRSKAGRRFGRVSGSMRVTDRVSECLARLPLWLGMEPALPRVIEIIKREIKKI
jgi:dTDP-4-amino-4,6-dideoxygalactose transaminase